MFILIPFTDNSLGDNEIPPTTSLRLKLIYALNYHHFVAAVFTQTSFISYRSTPIECCPFKGETEAEATPTCVFYWRFPLLH